MMMRLGLAVAAFFLISSISSAQAEYPATGRQVTPPVFKDIAQNSTQPPALPPNSQPGDNAAGTTGTVGTPIVDDDPGGQTTIEQAPAAEASDDPCAASMDNIDSYTVCQDMIQKIERMKKGAATRKEVYHPKPKEEPKEEKKEEGDKKVAENKDEKKDGDKKEEAKKDGDKDKDADKDKKDEEKKEESSAKKDESASEEKKEE